MARRLLYRGRVSIRAVRLINSFPTLLPYFIITSMVVSMARCVDDRRENCKIHRGTVN